MSVAAPCAPGAGVNDSVPLAATAGCPPAVKSVVSLLVTVKLTTCADSSAGPGEIACAQPATVWAPAFSLTV